MSSRGGNHRCQPQKHHKAREATKRILKCFLGPLCLNSDIRLIRDVMMFSYGEPAISQLSLPHVSPGSCDGLPLAGTWINQTPSYFAGAHSSSFE